MALPLWPTTLPTRPLQDGTSIDGLRRPPVATDMEDGFRRQRPRSTTKLADMTLTFMMDQDQAVTFLQFVTDDLHDGAQRFEMPVWKPGAGEVLPVRTVQILGAASAIKFRNVGIYEYVSFPVRIWDY